MDDSKKWVALGVGGFLAFAGVAGGALFWMMGASENPTPKMVSGSLTDLANQNVEELDYEPSSGWMEEGLDPNVTKFDIGDAPPSGSEGPADMVDVDAVVANTIAQRQNDLMPCYASVLEQEDVQGNVNMQFGVAPDGHVAMVTVTSSTLASKDAEDCFVDVARKWTFPKTGRGVLTKFDSDFGFYYE